MKFENNLKCTRPTLRLALKVVAAVLFTLPLMQCAATDKPSVYKLTTKAHEKDLAATSSAKSPIDIDSILMLAADGSPDQMWELTPEAEGRYRIANKSLAGKSLEVKDTQLDSAVRMAASANDEGQLWELVPIDKDVYRIVNKWRGASKSLGAGKVERYQIYLLDANDRDSQLWKKIDVGNGYFRLVNKLHGDAIVLFPYEDGGLGFEPAKDNSFTYQHWKMEPAGADMYTIVNRFEAEKNLARSLDIVGDSQSREPVKLTPSKGTPEQKWKMEKAGNDYFRLVGSNSKSLQVEFLSMISIYMKDTADNDPSQLWKLTKAGS